MLAARPMIGLGLLVVTLGACVGAGTVPETHYYTLRPPAQVTPSGSGGAHGLDVGVRSLSVDPPYDQDRLVYREGAAATEVGFYAYHRWAAPLGRLFAVALADALRGTEGIASIEPARPAVDYSAALDGRVIYLEEVDSPGRQEARLALELVLTDSAGGILWSSTLTGAAADSTREVPEVVVLFQRAVDQVAVEAAAQIQEALREAAAGAPG